MSESINLEGAKNIKIFTENIYQKLDRLGQINYIFDILKSKYDLDILIQSSITHRRDLIEYQCMIGYALYDNECAITISNGLGEGIEVAIINSINEFIEYFININKDLLKVK